MKDEHLESAPQPDAATVVVLGLSQSRTVVFDGDSEGLEASGEDDIVLILLHLGSGDELRLPISHEQADEVVSFYLSALGSADGDEGAEDAPRATEATERPAEEGGSADPAHGGRSRVSLAQVLEL